jgi:hypothetical protein
MDCFYGGKRKGGGGKKKEGGEGEKLTASQPPTAS